VTAARAADVPVLLLTAHPGRAAAADELGAAATLAKPFDLEELLRSLASLLEPESAVPPVAPDRVPEAG
jgi:DNA-binding NtrC family response regulator